MVHFETAYHDQRIIDICKMCLCQILVLLCTCFAMSTKMAANCKPPIATCNMQQCCAVHIDDAGLNRVSAEIWSLVNTYNSNVPFSLQPKVPLDILPVPNGTIVQRNKSSNHALLNVENPSFPARTSLEWLKQHGLKGGFIFYTKQVFFPSVKIPVENSNRRQ